MQWSAVKSLEAVIRSRSPGEVRVRPSQAAPPPHGNSPGHARSDPSGTAVLADPGNSTISAWAVTAGAEHSYRVTDRTEGSSQVALDWRAPGCGGGLNTPHHRFAPG